jgi:IS30 family transposase
MGQLTKTDRQEIAYYLGKGHKKSNIGGLIGRSKSVVTNEIKRNSVKGVYDAKKAHVKAYQRRYWVEKEPQKIRSNPELITFIESKLKQLNPWSPETIAGCWNKEKDPDTNNTISAPTIYKYLYKNRPKLCKYLCQKRYKKKKYKKKIKREMIQNRIPITNRPKIVEKRERIGDWEGDTIVSCKGDKTALLVLHDRASRYIRVSKTKDITKKRMIPKVKKLLKNLPQHTLTLDNGIEFKGHQRFGINTFFCQPYASWEKGAVEYSNRLIRRHFPKKTRLADIHQKKLASIISAINNTPRKCLNWKTPHQVFFNNSLS